MGIEFGADRYAGIRTILLKSDSRSSEGTGSIPTVVSSPSLTPTLEEFTSQKSKPLPPWNVVLLDDDDHSYQYVIFMLQRLFGHSLESAYLMAKEVDSTGRVIVFSTHKERAELERDRIHSFGADPLIDRCKGSMSAIIEPACGQ